MSRDVVIDAASQSARYRRWCDQLELYRRQSNDCSNLRVGPRRSTQQSNQIRGPRLSSWGMKRLIVALECDWVLIIVSRYSSKRSVIPCVIFCEYHVTFLFRWLVSMLYVHFNVIANESNVSFIASSRIISGLCIPYICGTQWNGRISFHTSLRAPYLYFARVKCSLNHICIFETEYCWRHCLWRVLHTKLQVYSSASRVGSASDRM
jgi:hypothetical protein